MKRALFLIVLVVGCAQWSTDPQESDNRSPNYELAQDIVVDVWKEKFDYITNGSADALKNFVLVEAVLSEIKHQCTKYNPQHPPKSPACHIWISEDEEYFYIYSGLSPPKKECAMIHELIHLLSSYDFDDPQRDHSDPALWDEFGDDSVESIACIRLNDALLANVCETSFQYSQSAIR